jgi:hypothetical protein
LELPVLLEWIFTNAWRHLIPLEKQFVNGICFLVGYIGVNAEAGVWIADVVD